MAEETATKVDARSSSTAAASSEPDSDNEEELSSHPEPRASSAGSNNRLLKNGTTQGPHRSVSLIHDRRQEMEGHSNDTGLADPTDNDKRSQAEKIFSEILIVLDRAQSRTVQLERRCTEQDQKILGIQTNAQQRDWLVAENSHLRVENARLHTEVEQLRRQGIMPAGAVDRYIQETPDIMERATVPGYAPLSKHLCQRQSEQMWLT